MSDGTVAPHGDAALVDALRAGDQAAFEQLIDELGPSLLRIARGYVPSRAVAEEVVQETWLGVLNGIDRFEGRSQLRTWIFRILVNRAKTRGERERRQLPFSAFSSDDDDGPVVDPDRFFEAGHRIAGHWSSPPHPFDGIPEARLIADETLERIEDAIATLPEKQRIVITMRDVDGFSSDDVRNVLEISESNQRVLLHRARSKVRQALEDYFTDD